MTSIRATKIVTPERVIENGYILFDSNSGLITEVSDKQDFTTDISVTGTLIPGFVDIHCHGGGGFSFDDIENVSKAASFHLKHGTTSLVASLVSAPVAKQIELLQQLAKFVDLDEIAGVHLEGPFLSKAKCGAQNPGVLTTPESKSISQIISAANGNLKQITIAPEIENGLYAIQQFTENGIVVALGHSDADADQSLAGVAAGATIVTHLFNAMRSPHHRNSGLADVALTDSRLKTELIADGHHVGDLSIALARATKNRNLFTVTDAISAAGQPDGEYKLGGLSVNCTNDVAVISGTKTLAGSTLNMERVFERLLKVYEFDLLDAVWATSTTAANAINLKDVGSLEAGMKANFIIWDDGVKSVYKNGNLVHTN